MINSMRFKNYLSASLIILALTFIGLGFFQQGFLSVMRKAIFICLECIGIG
ncbi:MAG: CD1871A family CXXC motif-containing protein [Treponemataceae bacterium]